MSENEVESGGKSRSSIEKMIVWGGIAILGILVLVEFLGQRNYNGAMAWLEANENRSKTLADVRAAMSGASESDLETDNKESAKKFSWFSLFKKYEVVATMDGEGDTARLTGFYNPDAMDLVQKEMQDTLNSKEVGEPAVPGDTSTMSGEPAEDNSEGGPGESSEASAEDVPEDSGERDATPAEEAPADDSEAEKPAASASSSDESKSDE